ncbi:helix-turn-helix domain-containing protein [Nibricoccus sp. IMCC34717]|uniref:AraC family transcriptional regulator n=1 Tax=Nibricoccus sp. IMCC34717 TaxID=3034021 RepID=UPI00384A56F6
MDKIMDYIQEGFPFQTLVRMPPETIDRMRSLPLCKRLYVTDVGCYPQARYNLVKRPQGCPNHIFFHCAAGDGWVETRGAVQRIREGQVAVIPANLPHSYGSWEDRTWSQQWIHFNGSDADGLQSWLLEGVRGSVLNVTEGARVGPAIQECIQWTHKAHTDSMLLGLCSAAMRVLGLVLDARRQSGRPALATEERVRETIALMKANLEKPLTLEELAQRAALSVAQYGQLFRRLLGTTPMKMYHQLRISRACALILDTTLPIRVIGEMCGYPDPFHFSRAFRKLMGQSPQNYRAEAQAHF